MRNRLLGPDEELPAPETHQEPIAIRAMRGAHWGLSRRRRVDPASPALHVAFEGFHDAEEILVAGHHKAIASGGGALI
jgi:hypothetical protein